MTPPDDADAPAVRYRHHNFGDYDDRSWAATHITVTNGATGPDLAEAEGWVHHATTGPWPHDTHGSRFGAYAVDDGTTPHMLRTLADAMRNEATRTANGCNHDDDHDGFVCPTPGHPDD